MPAARPSQAVITNAIQAALACGLPVLGIEVTPEGGVKIIADPAAAAVSSDGEKESAWDSATGAGS